MNTKPASASWSVKCLAQIPARPDLRVSSPISTVTLGSRGQHRRAVRGLGMAIGHSEAEPFMGSTSCAASAGTACGRRRVGIT